MSQVGNACTLACSPLRRASWHCPSALGTPSQPQGNGRARRVLRAAWREATLEHDDAVSAEPQMWKTHGLHGCRDRTCVHEINVLANAPDRDVRPQRFVVEPDGAAAKLGANVLAERQQVRRAGTDPEPDDSRTAGRRKAAGTVQLDVERGDTSRGCLGRCGHISQPLIRGFTEERQRDVHELRLHAAKRGKVRGAAECRLGDLGWEWERDEEPYPRRLEPCGVRLVSD